MKTAKMHDKEAVMDNPENEFVQIHQEGIRSEATMRQALRQSGITNPNVMDRSLTWLGDALIRAGTILKGHAYTRLTAEEASAPSFLIML
jgi:hypothetical protein